MVNLGVRMPKAIATGLILLGASLTGCSGGSSSHTSSAVPQSLPVRSTKLASVAGGASLNAYAATILADAPVSYYPLSDTTSTLVDAGPNGISGTYGSGVTFGVPPLTANAVSALGFPGGVVYNPNGFAFTLPNAALQPATVTTEAWIRFTTMNTDHDQPIVVYGNALSGVRYGLYLHGLARTNYSTILYMQNNTGQASMLRMYGVTRISVGVTYHIVAVSDGTQVTTYINGLVDTTANYPGAINYSVPPTNGLQIGGAISNPTYGNPPFAGTIAQVAVYNKPLTSAQVVSHFIAGQFIPMVTENATAADKFVDSIGVNAHFGASGAVDSSQFPQASSLLVGSGIRHVRVLLNPNSPSFMSQMKQLAASGIHGNYIVPTGTTQSQVLAFPAQVSPSLESFEAPNEPDDQPGQAYPLWVPGCIAAQQQLYSWIKGSPATAQYPLLGPGLAWSASFAELGNVSAHFDRANIHDYLGNYNPGNSYASSIVTLARTTSGGKPIIATETGYGTGTTSPLLDDRTDLRYMTRTFFEFFNDGIARSYSYDFIQYDGLSKFGQYGLVHNNLTPKPAYFGLKSLIGALRDPGSAFTPSPLTFRLSGFTNNVHHLLMQKRNGTFVLAIWVEAPGWDTTTPAGGDIVVPGQVVTLATSANFSTLSRQSMDESGALSTSSVPWSANQATFTVTDTVSLLTLTP
jgi:hypothetical protein